MQLLKYIVPAVMFLIWLGGAFFLYRKKVKKPVDKEIETNYSKDVRQW